MTFRAPSVKCCRPGPFPTLNLGCWVVAAARIIYHHMLFDKLAPQPLPFVVLRAVVYVTTASIMANHAALHRITPQYLAWPMWTSLNNSRDSSCWEHLQPNVLTIGIQLLLSLCSSQQLVTAKESTNHSINQSINQLMDQAISSPMLKQRPIDQSIN